MIKLFAGVLHALLWDENAARRWLRGIVSVLALSGGIYADQIAALLPAATGAKAASAIRFAAFLCAFGTAAHDAKTKKKGLALVEPKP